MTLKCETEGENVIARNAVNDTFTIIINRQFQMITNHNFWQWHIHFEFCSYAILVILPLLPFNNSFHNIVDL